VIAGLAATITSRATTDSMTPPRLACVRVADETSSHRHRVGRERCHPKQPGQEPILDENLLELGRRGADTGM
jgi:hypothetical protein